MHSLQPPGLACVHSDPAFSFAARFYPLCQLTQNSPTAKKKKKEEEREEIENMHIRNLHEEN